MSGKSNRKLIQRVFIIISSFALLGTSGIFLTGIFGSDETSSQPTTSDNNSELQAKISGYQKVLEREPNNPIALQGLVETHLQMNNLKEAIAPLEKLVKLNPKQQELKALLTVVKQQSSQQSTASSESKVKQEPKSTSK